MITRRIPASVPATLALVLSAALSGCSASQDALHPGDPDVIAFQVDGLACPNCATHVAEELREVPGVKAAQVDFDAKQALVRVDPARRPAQATLDAKVAQWKKEHYAAETDAECLDPAKREQLRKNMK